MKIAILAMSLLVGLVPGVRAEGTDNFKTNQVKALAVVALASGGLAYGAYMDFRNNKRMYEKLKDPFSPESRMFNANGSSGSKSMLRKKTEWTRGYTIALATISLTSTFFFAQKAWQLRAGARDGQTGMWLEKKF